MSGNQQGNEIFAERMNANERKVENFSTGEDTVVDMQRPTTQKSPLECLQAAVTYPLLETKASNTDGPKAGWVIVQDVLWLS